VRLESSASPVTADTPQYSKYIQGIQNSHRNNQRVQTMNVMSNAQQQSKLIERFRVVISYHNRVSKNDKPSILYH